MLDLGRKLAAEQVTAEAGEVATVVVELGQDFSQLCFPSTIRPRPYSQAEDLAVVSPVKHCRRPGFVATRGMHLPLPAATASPFKREISQRPSRMIPHHARSMAEISYVKRDTASFCEGRVASL